jgi:hypothetical protein
MFGEEMKTIDIHLVGDEPTDVQRYPDFLVTALLRSGVGFIESVENKERASWNFVLTSRNSAGITMLSMPPRELFRPILARIGIAIGDSPYCGHTLFAVEPQMGSEIHTHRFSLFICNEPTMGFWMKLYLYCIDDVWPTKPNNTEVMDFNRP